MNKYSQKILEHFQNPRNVGEIKDPDGVGEVGNPVCGDLMKITIKVGKRKKENQVEEYIKDIKFKTFGCIAAVATSSMVTELVKGKSLEEAEKITSEIIEKALDGLPPEKLHCSHLAADAIHAAIKDYKEKKNK